MNKGEQNRKESKMNKGEQSTWIYDYQSIFHCSDCYQNGGKRAVYGIVYKYSHSGSHTWTHVFPCLLSRQEYFGIFEPIIEEYEYFKTGV